MSDSLTKAIRSLAIALLGFTVAFAILAAVGTACVAWSAEKWGAFAVLAPFKWLYQILVYLNFGAGLGGIAVAYALLRGKRWSYMGAMVTLVIFLATAVVQMHYSSMLRGVPFFSTPPTSIRFDATLIVFTFFFLLRMTKIREKTGFLHPAVGNSSSKGSAGLSLVMAGVTTLATLFLAGSSHTVNGYNLARILEFPLIFAGTAMLLTGVGLLALPDPPMRPHLLALSPRDTRTLDRTCTNRAVPQYRELFTAEETVLPTECFRP
jgi:hypothetical protein